MGKEIALISQPLRRLENTIAGQRADLVGIRKGSRGGALGYTRGLRNIDYRWLTPTPFRHSCSRPHLEPRPPSTGGNDTKTGEVCKWLSGTKEESTAEIGAGKPQGLSENRLNEVISR